VTIGLLFRALTTERGLIARLLVATALPEQIRRDAERYVAQH
jgi:hypothetical protein